VDTVVVLRSWPSVMHTLARLDVNGPVDLMHVVECAFSSAGCLTDPIEVHTLTRIPLQPSI
jgi:hypothetical protein